MEALDFLLTFGVDVCCGIIFRCVHMHVKSTHQNRGKIKSVKFKSEVEWGSTFKFMCDLSYIVCILQVKVNFINVCM